MTAPGPSARKASPSIRVSHRPHGSSPLPVANGQIHRHSPESFLSLTKQGTNPARSELEPVGLLFQEEFEVNYLDTRV